MFHCNINIGGEFRFMDSPFAQVYTLLVNRLSVDGVIIEDPEIGPTGDPGPEGEPGPTEY